MSIPPATSLQFDHEESDAPQIVDCSHCQQRILSEYYEVAGNLLCERCKLDREKAPEGSRFGRFGLAFIAGLGTAIAGSLLYYGITALTGYEFGLIAIVVGFGVGKAVHWGSKARGGWRYQALAVGLTYLSIVATYVPPVIQQIAASGEAEAAAAAKPAAATSTTGTVAAASVTPAAAEPQVDLGGLVMALALFAGIMLAAPFLAGFQNIIGLLIIAFGLFEAWKINRKSDQVVTGPFRLADRTPTAT
ncbi:MAG TPA: hypothetical protein VFV49_01265, partial [Thermoanaerobaculia bacterium]|nr:hypothetical protein [Thermoanaerobaculia bacterium]